MSKKVPEFTQERWEKWVKDKDFAEERVEHLEDELDKALDGNASIFISLLAPSFRHSCVCCLPSKTAHVLVPTFISSGNATNASEPSGNCYRLLLPQRSRATRYQLSMRLCLSTFLDP